MLTIHFEGKILDELPQPYLAVIRPERRPAGLDWSEERRGTEEADVYRMEGLT